MNSKQTQFHEKNCRFVVSKFVKLSDKLIICLMNYLDMINGLL